MHESVRLDPDQSRHLYRTWSGSKLFAKVIIIYMAISQHIPALVKKVFKMNSLCSNTFMFYADRNLEKIDKNYSYYEIVQNI